MDGSIRVVALQGNEPVGAWEFEKETVTIGRSKTADVRLDDAAISRIHCIVELRPSGIFVKDNGSRNGIWLNGRRVAEALVSSRDEVLIERFRLKIYMVWGQNTAAKKFGDRVEEKTRVPGQADRAPKPAPAPMAKPAAKPAPSPKSLQETELGPRAPARAASKPAPAPRAKVPAAPALEETGAMEPVARPSTRGVTAEMEDILADVRPQPRTASPAAKPAPAPTRTAPMAAKAAAATPAKAAKPAARPAAERKPVAKPAPVFVDYDEDEEEETLPPAFDMVSTLAGAKLSRPLEGKSIVEVIRYRGVNVLDVTRLERGDVYVMPFTDVPLVSFDGEQAGVEIADGMTAELRSGRTAKPVYQPIGIQWGQVVDVQIDDVGYLVRLTERVEPNRNAPMNAAALGGIVTTGASSIALHVFIAGVLMLVQALKPETPQFTEFAKIEMPKEPEVAKLEPTPAPTPESKPTPPPPPQKMPKTPPERLAKRPTPRQTAPEGGADRTEAKVASAGVLGGLGKVNVKLDSPNSALAAVTNLDAVRSTAGRGGGFKVSALTGKVPGDAVLGRAGRANGTVEISTISGNDLGARGGFGGHALNGGGKVRGVVTQTPTANVGVQGTLSREEIAAVVNKHLTEIRRCYEKNLINDPSLAGRVQVEWTINPNGSVAAVKTKFSSLKGGDVTGCISGAIRTWMFPRPKGNGYVIVNYPFNFDSVGF